MRGACFVNPNTGAGRAIELASNGEERAQLRAGQEGAEHGLARSTVKRTHCVDGEDCSAGIDLGSRAEDARQSLAAGTRAEAVLVREASMLEVWCESLCQGSSNNQTAYGLRARRRWMAKPPILARCT